MTVDHPARSARRRLLLTLKQTIDDIRARNAGADPGEVRRIVDEAVREVRKAARKEYRAPAKPRPRKRRRHPDPVAPGQPLDHRERVVLKWSAKGETKIMIARRLGISQSYVKFFCQRIFTKLRARTMAHAVAEGFKLGYLDLSKPRADRHRRRK
jgi:DNA-binding CsgD family transcriptional regulator